MEIQITNEDKDPIYIDADKWDLKEYQDAHRAVEFRLECNRRIPIARYAHVIATEGRDVLFRGYVTRATIQNINTRELTCKGEEELLRYRFTGRYAYQAAARRLFHAFQSDAPNQTADAYSVTNNVGLIFMANSIIPYHGNVLITSYGIEPNFDWWAMEVDWIYRLAGLGTLSRIGSSDIYFEGKNLPRQSTYAGMAATAISCYSDPNDLYLRVDDDAATSGWSMGFGPRAMMMAANAYDTHCRAGTIDKASTVIDGNLQMNFDRIQDILIDLAEYNGLNIRYRRTRDYTYIDALDEPTETEFTLSEENIRELEQRQADEPLVHALIGLGYGSRDAQHVWVPSDHTWKGVWVSDTVDVEDGFLDTVGNLKPIVQANYNIRQADEFFSVRTSPDYPYRPRPNNLVRLKLFGESDRLLQVASASINDRGDYRMEIGGRKNDLLDAFAAKDGLSRIYQDEYLVEYGKAITLSGEDFQLGDLVHNGCTGATGDITIPSDVYEANWSHRVTLDISITTDQKPRSCLMLVDINGVAGNFLCQPRHYLLNETVMGLDITKVVNYGSATTVAVWIMLNGNWTGANCAAHPTFDLSTTARMWKRPSVVTDPSEIRPYRKRRPRYCRWADFTKYYTKLVGYRG